VVQVVRPFVGWKFLVSRMVSRISAYAMTAIHGAARIAIARTVTTRMCGTAAVVQVVQVVKMRPLVGLNNKVRRCSAYAMTTMSGAARIAIARTV
jgi:hypothetical protein